MNNQLTLVGQWSFDGISFAANAPVKSILCCDYSDTAILAKNEFDLNLFSLESHTGTRECWTSFHVEKLVNDLWPTLPTEVTKSPIVSYSSSKALEKLQAAGSVKAFYANKERLKIFFDNKKVSKKIFRHLKLALPISRIIRFSRERIQQAVEALGPPVVARKIFSSIGSGTFHIDDSKKAYEQLLRQGVTLDETIIIEQFVAGIPVNINAAILDDGIHVYEPSIQLIGIKGLTDMQFGFCGNDYQKARQLRETVLAECRNQTQLIGAYLRRAGFKGIFGIDVIVTENDVCVPCEINPRFQSSTALLNWTYHKSPLSPAALQLKAFGYGSLPEMVASSEHRQLYSQAIIHVLESEAGGIVTQKLAQGRYSVGTAGQLHFVESTLSPLRLQDGEILIVGSPPAPGTKVSDGAPLIKVIIKDSILPNDWNTISSPLYTALMKAKTHLRIQSAATQ